MAASSDNSDLQSSNISNSDSNGYTVYTYFLCIKFTSKLPVLN